MTIDLDTKEQEIWQVLEQVSDPEIPVLSVVDLGVIRQVNIGDDTDVEIVITPTYSGCPAMKVIEEDISKAMKFSGFNNFQIKTVLNPPWTTDWLSENGRKKLFEYGIAPPVEGSEDKNELFSKPKHIQCPNCKSTNTKMKSQFGSTPCKSLYVCADCQEPFDYFKCI